MESNGYVFCQHCNENVSWSTYRRHQLGVAIKRKPLCKEKVPLSDSDIDLDSDSDLDTEISLASVEGKLINVECLKCSYFLYSSCLVHTKT